MVEPPAPELAAHERAGGLLGAQGREALGGAGAERSRRVQLGDGARGEHVGLGLVDGEQRHGGAGVAEHPGEFAQVVVVGAVRAVLVLDLHEDDGAAAVDLQRRDDLEHLSQVGRDGGEVARLARAHAYAGFAQQPAGQPSPVELGADVGARPHDRVHALGLHLAQEPGEVEAPRRVEDALLGGVLVPRDVRLDGVESHHPAHADAVAPLVGVHAEVVQRARDHTVRAAVEQEVVVSDGEG